MVQQIPMSQLLEGLVLLLKMIMKMMIMKRMMKALGVIEKAEEVREALEDWGDQARSRPARRMKTKGTIGRSWCRT